ncbi:MAG: PstS family phosphate ABC transporter substrate-binding protein [Fimbriimonadaceae bacterium]|nr:PstS family phosphate ABC transporter substrate-binding protein [Fimbriimonadaceae bacterium]QYK57890.1 MAG: PstS family phosphate ABC transporter substrate-binding protein [Fimbriimonadaceae bacterium]
MSSRTVGILTLLVGSALAACLVGCGPTSESGDSGSKETGSKSGGVSGSLTIDGSSTVTPILAAVAEEFSKTHPDSRVTVGTSGTGGGFKKFDAGEIDISMASRPIKQEEIDKAKANGIDFIELPVALDGLTVVVNKENNWVDHLTVAELKKIWEPGSKINNWKDVRPGFPDVPLKLYGAGTDSGTFDYFTLAIVGKEKASRTDYQASEDDNVLIQGVKGDKGALGYFGFGYYEENQDDLKAVAIDNGSGPVAPSVRSVVGATYQPLSRPLLIYVSTKAMETNKVVGAFMEYFFANGSQLVEEAKFIPLPKEVLDVVKKHFDERKTGSLFKGAEVGLGIAEILKRETGG